MTTHGHPLPLRPEVRHFAETMEIRLQQHETDRNDQWRMMTRADLAVRLRRSQQQFFDTLAAHAPKSVVQRAAADAANYIMFMAEVEQ